MLEDRKFYLDNIFLLSKTYQSASSGDDQLTSHIQTKNKIIKIKITHKQTTEFANKRMEM